MPLFQKRHYEFLSKEIRMWLRCPDLGINGMTQIMELTHMLAIAFQRDNPRFNKEKWIKATLQAKDETIKLFLDLKHDDSHH